MTVHCVFTDRYDALGIHPDPKTICHGPCEGIGYFPVHRNEPDHHEAWLAQYRKERKTLRFWWEWLQGHRSYTDWMFVRCPDCHGTGKHD